MTLNKINWWQEICHNNYCASGVVHNFQNQAESIMINTKHALSCQYTSTKYVSYLSRGVNYIFSLKGVRFLPCKIGPFLQRRNPQWPMTKDLKQDNCPHLFLLNWDSSSEYSVYGMSSNLLLPKPGQLTKAYLLSIQKKRRVSSLRANSTFAWTSNGASHHGVEE